MKKPKVIKLTEKQARFIYWMLDSGHDQHCKFLLHDDWDAGMTKKEIHRSLSTHRSFLKAKKILGDAYERC